MSPVVAVLIKLAVRLVVFTGVFWFAAKRNKSIVFEKKWAPPLVGVVFAVLSTALYWVLKFVANIATVGMVSFALPVVINGVLLYATLKIFEKKKWFRIDGFFATIWMILFLTLAHGVLWFGLDFIPTKV
jgi:uncharacterized membrane protein